MPGVDSHHDCAGFLYVLDPLRACMSHGRPDGCSESLTGIGFDSGVESKTAANGPTKKFVLRSMGQ